MKTVTIPTCANPFVVIVNGIKYTYPAGATMEVPDDVAEVIEQHEEAKPEPAPVLPPFASVPSTGGGEIIPTFNLVEMGLPALTLNEQSISVDTTKLMDALDKGVVKLHVALDGLGEIDLIGSVFSGFGMYQVIGYYMSGDMNVVIIIVSEGSITAHGTAM